MRGDILRGFRDVRRRGLGRFCNKTRRCAPSTETMTILSLSHSDNPLGRRPPVGARHGGAPRRPAAFRRTAPCRAGGADAWPAAGAPISSASRPKGEIWIVEIKTSIEDFRVDRKWPDYRLHCDRLFFATHRGVPLDIFPEECGVRSLGRLWRRISCARRPSTSLRPRRAKSVTLSFRADCRRRGCCWPNGRPAAAMDRRCVRRS